MEQAAGQHSDAAVFAAEGPVRNRIVRVVVAAGVALLAAWLIALGLGVLGGFDSLPALPGISSKGSNQASSDARTPQATPRPAARNVVAPKPASMPRAQTSPASASPAPASSAPTSGPKRSVTKVKPTPSPPTPSPSTGATHGRALGTTKTTSGKPLGSPGNGPGGSGAPGQLR
jgi:hypothetical protein